jgi:hypothetical protein
MGFGLFTDEDFVTWEEFVQFVSNAHKFLETNFCIWNPAQQATMRAFFVELIRGFENVNPVDPTLAALWGSPGPAWAASTQLRQYFYNVQEAVSKDEYEFAKNYYYTINVAPPEPPVSPDTLITTLGPYAARELGRFFLIVGFFWGCYVDKDNCQEFFFQCDYANYAYLTVITPVPVPPASPYGVDRAAARAFTTGMSRIHFCGREVTLPPNRLVILQTPAFLLTGRLVEFPRDITDNKCCQVNAVDCIQRVNCGVFITKLARDVFCDITCRDPCRRCNLTSCGCAGEGGVDGRFASRLGDELNPEGIAATGAGDAGVERQFRENFVTIRPFVNTDLLIPEIQNRIGKFGEFPFNLALPADFLTDREIRERDYIRDDDPYFNEEFPPGDPRRTTRCFPCGPGGVGGPYRAGLSGGCRNPRGAGVAGSYGQDYGEGLGCPGGNCSDKGHDHDHFKTGTNEKGPRSSQTGDSEKGPRSFQTEVRGTRRREEVERFPDGGVQVTEEVEQVRGRPAARGRGRRVPCGVPSVQMCAERALRPRNVFGLLEYLIEKMDYISIQVQTANDQVRVANDQIRVLRERERERDRDFL